MQTGSQRGSRPPLLSPLAVLATAAVIGVLLYLLHYTATVLLVAFAGILLGVLLDGGARVLYTRTLLRRSIALGGVLLLIPVIIGVPAWLIGPRVANQAIEFADRIPQALERIRNYLSSQEWGERVLETLPDQLGRVGTGLIAGVTDIMIWTGRAVTTGIVMGALGLFLAFNPHLYLQGLLRLVPPAHRETIDSVMYAAARSLRRWLLARFLSMVVVGVLTGVGLAIAGVPLALTLGLIAGLLSFIPYLGPLLSVVPGLLVALGSEPSKVAWVLVVYIVVQLLESNLITPLIEQETTSVPAALLIIVQVLLALLVGGVGILLAAPLTVAASVFVQMLYVRRLQGERRTEGTRS